MNDEKRQELFKGITQKINGRKKIIIAVDGGIMVGKSSYISRPLAKFIPNAYLISFDDEDKDLLDVSDGRHNVKIEKLKKELDILLQKEQVVIIDGITMLDILKKIGLQQDILIYVKRMDLDGNWMDAAIYDETVPLSAAVAKLREQDPSFKLKKQIIEYHCEYKPLQVADFIFEKEIERDE